MGRRGGGGGVRVVCLRGGGPQPPAVSLSGGTGLRVQWSPARRRSLSARTHTHSHRVSIQYILQFYRCLIIPHNAPCGTSGTAISIFFLLEEIIFCSSCSRAALVGAESVKGRHKQRARLCEDGAMEMVKLVEKCERSKKKKGGGQRDTAEDRLVL